MIREVRIIATGRYMPPTVVDNTVVLNECGIKDIDLEWIDKKLGIKTRHIVRHLPLSDGQKATEGQLNSDLCKMAIERALDSQGIKKSEIDMLITATCTPDFLVPGQAAIVQEKLGMGECATMDVRSACCGAFQATAAAVQYLKAGTHKTVCVVGCDVGSVFAELDLGGGDIPKAAKVNALMMGDGCGCMILRGFDVNGAGEIPYGIEVLYTKLNSIGVGQKKGFWMPGGGCVNPPNQEMIDKKQHYFAHNFRDVIKHGPDLYFRAFKDTLKDNDLQTNDFDLLVPHQANGKLVEIGVAMGAKKERIYYNFDRVGNTANASCLICLDEIVEKNEVPEDGLVLLVGAESTKWLYGAILLKWHSLSDKPAAATSTARSKATYWERFYSDMTMWAVEKLLSVKNMIV